MLQRIQSLWLLFAAVFAFLGFKFSFYSGNILDNGQLVLRNLSSLGLTDNLDDTKADYCIPSILLAAATSVIALVAIFMFANRKTQIRMTLTALLISVINAVYMFYLTTEFSTGTFSLTSIFTFLPPVFLFLAWRGIYKDEKLVRSMDRLR
ncbi:MAG: hypothetical protein K0Q66_192 [Chitinophagaceae bacterium]|jgi:hypothetical protein|nr:hypothetical protein [Chitinophagaceae bacterium]